MRPRLFELLKFFIGWPLSLISIIFLLKFIPSSFDVVSKLKGINSIVLILSILFFQIYFLLRALVWQEILKNKGYKIDFKKVFFLWGFSELKRYTPGNIWSFIGRVVSFGKIGVNSKDVLRSLLVESELIILASSLVSLLSLNFIFNILPDTQFEQFTQPLIFISVLSLVLIFIFNGKVRIKFLPKFTYLSSLKLFVLTSFALLSFGAGSYFAANSIFFLDPKQFLSFSGFFVLALLIGYLSIITPMGLGVREGIITVTLSKIIPLSNATFIAVFSRFIFVLSEILFLTFSWVVYSTKNKVILKVADFISNHREKFILGALILSYFLYFTVASFLRYDAFYTGRFDLGNMDQTVWNTIHGRIFQLTDPNGTNIVSRLAFHADFILILLSPLYLLWSNPKTLLLLQSLIVPLGALFIYLISNELTRNKKISLLIGISFLLNPALQHANLYDFHPVVLATTFILASFYFMFKKKYLAMSIFLILSALSKENILIITSFFGLYLILFHKKIKLGLTIFMISLIYFYTVVWILIPKASGSQHFALSYYSDFGDSPTKIISGVLTSPAKTLTAILGLDRLKYLFQLFFPLSFLPLLSPLYLFFAVPSLLIDLLSNKSQLHTIYYQYSASVTPFIFIAAIHSIKLFKEKSKFIPPIFFALLIFITTCISAYEYGPLFGSKNPNISMFTENLDNEKVIDRFLLRIPKKYSVAATNEVGSHLSHRQKIYTIPSGIDKADVIVMLKRTPLLGKKEINLIESVDNKLLKDNNYFVVYKDDQFIVFKKKGLRKSFKYF